MIVAGLNRVQSEPSIGNTGQLALLVDSFNIILHQKADNFFVLNRKFSTVLIVLSIEWLDDPDCVCQWRPREITVEDHGNPYMALKGIYLRESLRNNWRTRKNSLGYTKLTESEFAKVLLCYVTLKSLFTEPIPCIVSNLLA